MHINNLPTGNNGQQIKSHFMKKTIIANFASLVTFSLQKFRK